jgi:tRNA-2-methylthio-N6-dimethylallyladenosine synthase
MNKLDTALVAGSLEDSGFRLTESVKEADVVLINTCSVREHAEQRVFSHLGHLKHIKESRPDLVVGVIGCMAQRLGDKLLEHEAVNLVCGPAEIPHIRQLITGALKERKKSLAITEKIRRKAPEQQSQVLEEFELAYGVDGESIPAQAFVRVMRGCNNFCSYCIVPYVRGPEMSRPPEAIIEQIKKLADHGVKQVTLLGQTVNSYRYKKEEKTWSLADLLEAAGNIEGIDWLRFVTSYPSEEFFNDIMQVMACSPKVCKYLHIPAQSGSDKILRAMNRNYTAAWYLELLDRARSIVPGIAIAGDFIVGFPGETDEDFQATVDLAKKAGYKNAFIFKYSPRPGTSADNRLQDTVSPEVKQRLYI